MKTLLHIVTVICLSSTLAISQGYYPLHVGDLWQFNDDPLHPSVQTESIIADTMLPNGETYAVYSGAFFYPARFIRQVGSKIVYRSYADSVDNTLFDFVAAIGDTIFKRSADSYWVALTSKSYNSSLRQSQWAFTYGFGGLANGGWTIVDSLGLFAVGMEPGVWWTLTGARINGQVRYGTILSVPAQGVGTPTSFMLFQNYPNPFNPSTSIRFFTPVRSFVSVLIWDLLGRRVANIHEGVLNSGFHTYTWNAINSSSGIYLCRVQAGDLFTTRKLLLIR
jgi:hypothetical protein